MFISRPTPNRSRWAFHRLLLLLIIISALSAPIVSAQTTTVTVDFATQSGVPTYRDSGFIYGLSENATQPPQSFQSDIKIRFIRAGGAQLDLPNGGWVNGRYTRRWNSVRAYYQRTQALGATFVLLPHDLWGADGQNNVPRWPGDNNNWTEYTQFLTQVINDVRAAGMTNIHWDIWNEPDLGLFWGRSQSQYLELWRRTYQQVRVAFPNAIIVGPSTAGQPSPGSAWYNTYLDFVRQNNVVPNFISWHELVTSSDPVNSRNNLNGMLSSRGISVQGFQVNEYGAPSEQGPGDSAWYIARLERGGMDGMRANWGGGTGPGGLYDTMGALVVNSGGYQPLGAWWVYRRYADMSGTRIGVTGSATIDGVASTDAQAARAMIVLGSRNTSGSVTVNIRAIASYLVQNGQVRVVVERIPSTNGTPVAAPTVIQDQLLTLNNNQVNVTLSWSNANDAHVISLTRPPTSSAGPIAWYQFEGNANDSSGNGRNGTLVNGPTFVAGRVGQAVNLDGSNDHVSLPAGIVNGLSSFTIATWVRLDTTSAWRRVFDFGTGTTVNMFLTPQSNTNALRFAITTSGPGGEQQINGPALPTGVWKHVAVTKSGNIGTLYVDGVQVGQNTGMTLSPSSLGNTTQNWIGRSEYAADPFLDGQIDQFRIYNRALSASEVLGLFQNP